jgi:hypothetical protein
MAFLFADVAGLVNIDYASSNKGTFDPFLEVYGDVKRFFGCPRGRLDVVVDVFSDYLLSLWTSIQVL